MEAMTATINGTSIAIAKHDLTPDLFSKFIEWIDRTEKTARTYIVNLRQFVAWMRYSAISRPENKDIISYREYLTAEHEAIQLDGDTWKYRTDGSGNRIVIRCKPNTVNQYLRSVCAFFKWTASEGFYPDIAANIHKPKIKHDIHRKDALTAQEVYKIETSIINNAAVNLTAAETAHKDTAGRIQRTTEQGKRLYAMYLLVVNAGLRTVEVSRADIKNLETRNGKTWLYIWGKGCTEPTQKKAIPPEVATAIQDYLQSRTDKPTGNSPLFAATGNRSKGKRLATTTISTMLKEAMKAAGFDSENISPHSLRHTAGQAAMKVTDDNIYKTQLYMRHSSPTTTEIYLNNNNEEQDSNIAQQIYNLYHGIESQSDSREQLQQAIQGMTSEQIEQLTMFAKAISK